MRKILSSFPVLAASRAPTRARHECRLTNHIFFRMYLCQPRPEPFYRAEAGFKGEFILSRPGRQISGIESLFSIRSPVHPVPSSPPFAPSSRAKLILTISICDSLSVEFSPVSVCRASRDATLVMADTDSLSRPPCVRFHTPLRYFFLFFFFVPLPVRNFEELSFFFILHALR